MHHRTGEVSSPPSHVIVRKSLTRHRVRGWDQRCHLPQHVIVPRDFPCIIAQGVGVIASLHVLAQGFLGVIAQGWETASIHLCTSSHKDPPYTSSCKGIFARHRTKTFLARHRTREPSHVIVQKGLPCTSSHKGTFARHRAKAFLARHRARASTA